MNEAQVTNEMMKFLRSTDPHAMILKHADRATIGVPDLSVTRGGRTVWVEVKLVKTGGDGLSPRAVIDTRAQFEMMRRFEMFGRALYVVFVNRGREWWTVVEPPSEFVYRSTRDENLFLGETNRGKRFDLIAQSIWRMSHS